MELQELEKKYTTLAEALTCAFFELNLKGKLIYINKEAKAMLGHEEGLLGKRFAEKVPKRQLYRLLEIFNEAVKRGTETGEIELKARERDYSVILVVRAVKSGEGVTGFQCFVKEGDLKKELLSPEEQRKASALLTARIALDDASKEKG
jgi:PAS domain S-box-containing protein